MRFARLGWPLLLLLAIFLLLGRVAQLDGPYVLFDDAYISFRYATNLSDGLGLVFNPEERVEGYTNFLWTALLAVFLKLGVDLTLSARILALLFAVGTLCLLYLLGKKLFSEYDNRLLLTAVPIVLFAAMGSQARYIISGMETLQFTFLVTLSIYVFLYHEAPFLAGILFALTAMTRPEGLLYFGLGLGFWVVAPGLLGQQRSLSKKVVWLILGFLLLYGAYFLWRYSYYGYPLPNTFYAKASAFHWLRVERGWQIFRQLISRWSLLPVLVLSLVALLPLRKGGPWLFLATMAAMTFLYFVFVGGDFIVWFGPRFLMPVLPALLLLCAEGIYRVSALRFVPRQKQYVVQLFLLLLLFVNALWFSWPTRSGRIILSTLVQEGKLIVPARPLDAFSVQMQGWAEMGRWIAEHTPQQATLAVDAAGLVPFYSQRYAIDMYGLTEPHIAHLPMPISEQSIVAHEKYDPNYILEQRPDYIFSSWLDEQGNAVSAGLASVRLDFDEQYELLAVAKIRNGPPSDGRWILVTDSYSPDLYEQGFFSGLFRRRESVP